MQRLYPTKIERHSQRNPDQAFVAAMREFMARFVPTTNPVRLTLPRLKTRGILRSSNHQASIDFHQHCYRASCPEAFIQYSWNVPVCPTVRSASLSMLIAAFQSRSKTHPHLHLCVRVESDFLTTQPQL